MCCDPSHLHAQGTGAGPGLWGTGAGAPPPSLQAAFVCEVAACPTLCLSAGPCLDLEPLGSLWGEPLTQLSIRGAALSEG